LWMISGCAPRRALGETVLPPAATLRSEEPWRQALNQRQTDDAAQVLPAGSNDSDSLSLHSWNMGEYSCRRLPRRVTLSGTPSYSSRPSSHATSLRAAALSTRFWRLQRCPRIHHVTTVNMLHEISSSVNRRRGLRFQHPLLKSHDPSRSRRSQPKPVMPGGCHPRPIPAVVVYTSDQLEALLETGSCSRARRLSPSAAPRG